MAERDTKARIMAAAERLFAERGLAGLSLRAVTATAGVNLGAVNYHFGSKEGLIRALVRRSFAAVDEARLRRLEALEAGTAAPAVEAILVAYAAPLFDLFDAPGAADWSQVWLAARRAERPSDAMPRAVTALEQAPAVAGRYLAALGRALPGLPPAELAWRFERVGAQLMVIEGRALRLPPEARATGTRGGERAWLITFLAGALGAPATGDGSLA